MKVLSPLRYPGGKKRLAAYVAETIRINELSPALLVEPFAGGAAVALQLVSDGLVDKILLGERDPLLAAFWKVVFDDPEWLIDQMYEIDVSLDAWLEFKASRPRSNRDRALKCLFLNRTSFSGILSPSAGPLGGRDQRSNYKIGCRFPVEVIERRIRTAYELRDRVLAVLNEDWSETIRRAQQLRYPSGQVLYYLDPPFYEKADRLYAHYFSEAQHRSLHNRLMRLKQPWLLSYDPAPEIVAMYSHNGTGPEHVDSLYSTTGLQAAEELIVTNLEWLPANTKLWHSKSEWDMKERRGGRSRWNG